MRIIRDYTTILPGAKGGALAIGNFDGVHKGHQAVIGEMLRRAEEDGLPKSVMTFEPHPRMFFHPESEPFRLMPFHQKMRYLQDMGVDIVYAFRFNAAFASLDAPSFVNDMLIGQLGVKHVVTGQDFIFGRGRSGNASTLYEAAHSGAFSYHAVAPQGKEGMTYSSSRIRQLIENGHMEEAADILGHYYRWIGTVKKGDQRGRTIGFPTANLSAPPVLMPAGGVYAVMVQIIGDKKNGVELMQGVANLGIRPTFGGQDVRLEVHLLDCEMDLYSKRLAVDFISHIRPEQKMEGIDALKAQITLDCQTARERLSNLASR